MATYQLLPTYSSSSSLSKLHHHQHHHQQQIPVQQRKALSFTILILMVATATLITIIRFTINPNISGNKKFIQPAIIHSKAVHHHQPEYIIEHKELVKKQINLNDNGSNGHNNKFNTLLTRDNSRDRSIKIDKNIFINDEMKRKFNFNNSTSNNAVIPSIQSSLLYSSVSPSSKQVTSLMADQRFEKDYRDDPVTMMSTTIIGTINNSTTTKTTTTRKPKVIFDQQDLAEIERMNIDKDDGCGEDSGAYADLIVLVNSAVFNFDARLAIRETWGKFAIERGAYFYFLLGLSTDQRVQELVLQEDFKYGDILQGSFVDNYYNLTLKTITMMRWISQKCSKIRYVLKVDDDMMMNMQHACDFTEINPNFHKVIIGKLAKKWKPHRYRSSKWYVPMEAYNQTFFPNFVTGPAYFFTGDAAKLLYETSINRNKTIPFYLEDVFMTGVVAEAAGIKRYNHAMMRNVHISKLDGCTFPKIMTSHKHTPNEIRELWKTLYSGEQRMKCIKTVASSAAAITNTRTTPKTKTIVRSESIKNPSKT